MHTKVIKTLMVICAPLAFLVPTAFAANGSSGTARENRIEPHMSRSPVYSIKQDIAFVSVWGSRPDEQKLRGFQRAVLFNARGEVVSKVAMGKDSVYSLDRIIQSNRARGPLYIRMYRK